MPSGQFGFAFGNQLCHNTSHQLIGIGSAFMYFQSRVTTFQTFDGYFQRNSSFVYKSFFVVTGSRNVNSASTANNEATPRFGVEVEQNIALKLVCRQIVCAIHTRFFISCDKSFNGSMFQTLVFHYGHDGSNANSVIGTKCCILSPNPFVVNPSLNWIGFEVMCAVG